MITTATVTTDLEKFLQLYTEADETDLFLWEQHKGETIQIELPPVTNLRRKCGCTVAWKVVGPDIPSGTYACAHEIDVD
jgi:hypothetical protein